MIFGPEIELSKQYDLDPDLVFSFDLLRDANFTSLKEFVSYIADPANADKKVIILCGPPSSGKTTFAEKMMERNPSKLVFYEATLLDSWKRQVIASICSGLGHPAACVGFTATLDTLEARNAEKSEKRQINSRSLAEMFRLWKEPKEGEQFTKIMVRNT